MDELQTKYYVRLKVADRVGALSETVDIFAKHNISISLINQVEDGKSGVSDACSVIFLTHRALEKDVQAAAAELASVDCVAEVATSCVSRTSRLDRRRYGQLVQHPLNNTRLGGLPSYVGREPFSIRLLSTAAKRHLHEPFIGNAGYRSPICKRGRFRLPLRCAANVRPR